MRAILSKVEPLCDYCISLCERLDNDGADREAWLGLKECQTCKTPIPFQVYDAIFDSGYRRGLRDGEKT